MPGTRTRKREPAPRARRACRGVLAGARQTAWLTILSQLAACPGPAGVDAGRAASDGAAGDTEPLHCEAWPSAIAVGQLGASEDSVAFPAGRLVLMGGGSEVDRAATAFVSGAGGGDVLVLRASGSVDSYTAYFYGELSPEPPAASVTTALLDQPLPASDPAVACHVDAAEALWLAGGDQADYLRRWPPSLHAALARAGSRGATLGGTSAGAMALGEVAFDAVLGSVTSAQALAEPLAAEVSVVRSPFAHPALAAVVVDTHVGARDREGRLLVFLARALALLGAGPVLGVGLDEEAALVVEGNHFEVQAAVGQRVRLYRVDGPSTLVPSSPLELEGILRAELHGGQQGDWPPDLAAWPTVSLRVVAGAVVTE